MSDNIDDELKKILWRHHHLPTEQDIQNVWDKTDTDVIATATATKLISELLTNKIKEAELRGRKEHFEEIVPDEGVDEDSKGSFADGYSKAVEDICDAHFARLTQLTNQYKGESDGS